MLRRGGLGPRSPDRPVRGGARGLSQVLTHLVELEPRLPALGYARRGRDLGQNIRAHLPRPVRRAVTYSFRSVAKERRDGQREDDRGPRHARSEGPLTDLSLHDAPPSLAGRLGDDARYLRHPLS